MTLHIAVIMKERDTKLRKKQTEWLKITASKIKIHVFFELTSTLHRIVVVRIGLIVLVNVQYNCKYSNHVVQKVARNKNKACSLKELTKRHFYLLQSILINLTYFKLL